MKILQDLVRKTLILFVREKLPAPVADIISSTLAAACGEAAYVAVKTPGEVLKIEQQAAVLEEEPWAFKGPPVAGVNGLLGLIFKGFSGVSRDFRIFLDLF